MYDHAGVARFKGTAWWAIGFACRRHVLLVNTRGGTLQ